MNCPECGRFMKLVIAFDIGEDAEVSAYWWVCNNEESFFQVDPVPAPEYQWLWSCETIPAEALLGWPELRQEYDRMWNALPNAVKRHYQHVLQVNQ